LTDGERTALVQAVALADQGTSGELRSQILSQVQGMGIYLRHTGDEGLPRWSMMSALRAYGLNLEPGVYSKAASQSGVAGVATTTAVQAKLASVVASRNVSVDHALAVAKQVAYVAPEAPARVAPKAAAPAPEVALRIEKVV
jgi:hypothetical protein